METIYDKLSRYTGENIEGMRISRLAKKYQKQAAKIAYENNYGVPETGNAADSRFLTIAKRKVAEAIEKRAESLNGNLPVISVFDALQIAKSAKDDRDMGLRLLVASLEKMWKKDRTANINAKTFLDLRDYYESNYPRSKVGKVFSEMGDSGYLNLPVADLIHLASKIRNQADFENEIKMAGLTTNRPDHVQARKFVLGLVNEGQNKQTQESSRPFERGGRKIGQFIIQDSYWTDTCDSFEEAKEVVSTWYDFLLEEIEDRFIEDKNLLNEEEFDELVKKIKAESNNIFLARDVDELNELISSWENEIIRDIDNSSFNSAGKTNRSLVSDLGLNLSVKQADDFDERIERGGRKIGQQSKKYLGNYGDVDWLTYGGKLLFEGPVVYVVEPRDYDNDEMHWDIYIVHLDDLELLMGNLIDEKNIKSVLDTTGMDLEDFKKLLNSNDPGDKLLAVDTVAAYFGWGEFDDVGFWGIKEMKDYIGNKDPELMEDILHYEEMHTEEETDDFDERNGSKKKGQDFDEGEFTDFDNEGWDNEPVEGDIVIQPSGSLGRKLSVSEVDGKFIGEFTEEEEMEDAIREWMDKKSFWPNIWFVSDHGNVERYNLHGERPLIHGKKAQSFNNITDNIKQQAYECPECGKILPTERGWKIHMTRLHGKPVGKPPEELAVDPPMEEMSVEAPVEEPMIEEPSRGYQGPSDESDDEYYERMMKMRQDNLGDSDWGVPPGTDLKEYWNSTRKRSSKRRISQPSFTTEEHYNKIHEAEGVIEETDPFVYDLVKEVGISKVMDLMGVLNKAYNIETIDGEDYEDGWEFCHLINEMTKKDIGFWSDDSTGEFLKIKNIDEDTDKLFDLLIPLSSDYTHKLFEFWNYLEVYPEIKEAVDVLLSEEPDTNQMGLDFSSEKETHECPICGKEVPTEKGLKIHMSREHLWASRKQAGSPGKFEGVPDELVDTAENLYDMAGNGMHDREAGESETTGWYAGFDAERAIIMEDSQGFISIEVFDNVNDYEEAWEGIEEDTSSYDEYEEEDEYEGPESIMGYEASRKRGSNKAQEIASKIDAIAESIMFDEPQMDIEEGCNEIEKLWLEAEKLGIRDEVKKIVDEVSNREMSEAIARTEKEMGLAPGSIMGYEASRKRGQNEDILEQALQIAKDYKKRKGFPSDALEQANKFLNDQGELYFGVEYLPYQDTGPLKDKEVLYINSGETYSPTIIYTEDNGFFISSWGDVLEDLEREYQEETDESSCEYCGHWSSENTCPSCGHDTGRSRYFG